MFTLEDLPESSASPELFYVASLNRGIDKQCDGTGSLKS